MCDALGVEQGWKAGAGERGCGRCAYVTVLFSAGINWCASVRRRLSRADMVGSEKLMAPGYERYQLVHFTLEWEKDIPERGARRG